MGYDDELDGITTEDRLYGLSGVLTGGTTYTNVGGSTGKPVDYYTDIWELMVAMKYNMRKYLETSSALKAFPDVKSWGVGFVFKETIRPAISIFPVSKVFLGARSGGLIPVQYTVSVDGYSSARAEIDEAKKYTFNIVDEVKRSVKQSIKMVGKDGTANSFATQITDQSMFESVDSVDRAFSSSSSMQVVCTAYHQMNTNRITDTVVREAKYDRFFERVVDLAKRECRDAGLQIQQWVTHTAKPTTASPIVMVLPSDEYVSEEHSNGYVTLVRPIRFHVLTNGYPKAALMRQNIKLTDKIVTAVERNYTVDGFAQQFAIQSINYGAPVDSGFSFGSTIEVTYKSRIKYNTLYN